MRARVEDGINWLCNHLGAPCEYDWKDEQALDVLGQWCEEHCSEVKDKECWCQYFNRLKERKHGDMGERPQDR